MAHRPHDRGGRRPSRPPEPRVFERERGGAPSGGQVWLFGRHPVVAALANPQRRVFRIMATPEAAERLQEDLAKIDLKDRALPQPEIVTRDRIAAALAGGAVHQGLLAAVGALPEPTLDDILAARDKLKAAGARVLGDGEPKIGAHDKPVLFLHPKDFHGTLIELEQA